MLDLSLKTWGSAMVTEERWRVWTEEWIEEPKLKFSFVACIVITAVQITTVWFFSHFAGISERLKIKSILGRPEIEDFFEVSGKLKKSNQ